MTRVNINMQERYAEPRMGSYHINGYHSAHNGVDVIRKDTDFHTETVQRNGKSHGEIADHKQLMQRLEESENKLKNFICHSFEGILMFDSNGHITEWNPAIEKITGIPKAKASGCFIWDMMYQLDLEGVRTPQRKDLLHSEMLEYMEDGEHEDPMLEERTVLTASGQIRHIRMSTFPIKLSADVCHYGCIMRDITRQRSIEMELNRFKANFEQMVKAKVQGLIVANGKINANC